jgi:hypothetical protein
MKAVTFDIEIESVGLGCEELARAVPMSTRWISLPRVSRYH